MEKLDLSISKKSLLEMSLRTLCVMLFITILINADKAMSKTGSDEKALKIHNFVLADGRLDMEAIQKAGYEGAIDLNGLTVQVDDKSGEPVFQNNSAGGLVPGDENWSNEFALRGASRMVFAIAIWNDQLVIGGKFTQAGPALANHVAVWDGNTWHNLGEGFNGNIRGLTVYNGDLIAAGSFSQAGGAFINGIARWDGTTWHPLDSGMYNTVFVVKVYNGDLIAGGVFSEAGGVQASGIARWDGNSWHPLGSGLNGGAYALAIYNNELIVGGGFVSAGGVQSKNIARWDGTNWNGMGSGANFPVRALEVYNLQLIAGGDFSLVNGMPADHVAAWDGSNWSTLGQGIGGLQVNALAVYSNELYAAGRLNQAGGMAVNNIARWDGASWHSVGGGIHPVNFASNGVWSLKAYNGELIAGGEFEIAGNEFLSCMAGWDGSSWRELWDGHALNSRVWALAIYNGNLVAGGEFTLASGKQIRHVGVWDGTTWNGLGDGPGSRVMALTVYNGQIVAGSDIGGYIKTWNGSSWQLLGSTNLSVFSLMVSNTDLIAGGTFTTVNGISANNIARYDGSNWHAMGSGLSGGIGSRVGALTEFNGEVVAGGDFSSAGNNIARWDGNSWHPLGSGTDDEVHALTVFNNNLIVAGEFNTAGSVSAHRIARWDGSSWNTVGTGSEFNLKVSALTVYNGDLIAAGEFYMGMPTEFIARWDGNTWSSLGSGLGFLAKDLATDGQNLYVGGFFMQAGGKPNWSVARWNDAGIVGAEEEPDRLPGKFKLAQNYPNPFNPTTTIPFSLPSAKTVNLTVYNALGQEVATLIDNQRLSAGRHEVNFNGNNLPSGIYYYRIQFGNRTRVNKMVLMK